MDKAVSAYEDFEYENALRLLRKAAGHPGSSEEEQARILLYQGLVHFTLGDQKLAEREFGQALKKDFSVYPPQDTSPKIISVFEAIKKTIPPPMPPEPPPDRAEPPPPVTFPAPTPPPPGKKGRVWTWVAAGIGGAALIGGGVFGGLAAQAKGEFDDEEWAGPAADLGDTVDSRAMTANILFGVGGAALVAAVVLFFVEDSGSAPAAEPRSSLKVEPGLLGVRATIRF